MTSRRSSVRICCVFCAVLSGIFCLILSRGSFLAQAAARDLPAVENRAAGAKTPNPEQTEINPKEAKAAEIKAKEKERSVIKRSREVEFRIDGDFKPELKSQPAPNLPSLTSFPFVQNPDSEYRIPVEQMGLADHFFIRCRYSSRKLCFGIGGSSRCFPQTLKRL